MATFLGVLAAGYDPGYLVAMKLANGIDSFPLLAIPFFIVSGLLMGQGGIARRLMDFAAALVGRFPGGLAYVNTLTCMLFGSISGSASAAVSSIGGRKTIFQGLTTTDDNAEVFGVTEFSLPVPAGYSSQHTASMIFNGGLPHSPAVNEGDVLRFCFSPRDAKVWHYEIKSHFPGLDGQKGAFNAVPPTIERTSKPYATHPNWWIDDPDPAAPSPACTRPMVATTSSLTRPPTAKPAPTSATSSGTGAPIYEEGIARLNESTWNFPARRATLLPA